MAGEGCAMQPFPGPPHQAASDSVATVSCKGSHHWTNNTYEEQWHVVRTATSWLFPKHSSPEGLLMVGRATE